MSVAYNQPLSILITAIFVELNVVHHLVFDRGLRAPSWSNCSKNGFSSSSARLSSEITYSLALAHHFFLASSGEATVAFFLILRGCAFSQFFIHNVVSRRRKNSRRWNERYLKSSDT